MKTTKTFKILGASLLAVSLLTVTACGSNKDGEKDGSVSATTSAVASSSAPASTSAAESPAETSVTDAPKETTSASEKKPATSAAGAPQPAPQALPGQVPVATVAPAKNGRPGTPAETQAITDMLKRQESATTVNEYFSIFVDSMCSEIINEQGGPEAFSTAGVPDMPLAAIPEYQATATKVTGVDDVLIEGERATAKVTTVTGAGETAANTMAFRNEQGNWKLCR